MDRLKVQNDDHKSMLGLFGKNHLKEEVTEIHQMMNVIDGVDGNQLFVAPQVFRASRYEMKLVRYTLIINKRREFFSDKVWKSLFLDDLHVKIMHELKGSLDKFIYKKSIVGN